MKFCGTILSLLVLWSLAFTGAAAEAGTISGKVLISEGTPMANGAVFFFNEESGPPPSIDKYWRVPDEIVVTDAAGSFKALLVDGRYYIGAIKRKSGEEIGPLQDGDLYLPFTDHGKPRTYQVSRGSALDIGSVTGAMTFSRSLLKTGPGVTAIEGIVTDASGKPVQDALVFAFISPAMMGKPLFISEKTRKDGKYLLRVSSGGSYYLKIRNSYGGGAMQTGEITGNFGEQDQPAPATVKTGATLTGIDISGSIFTRQNQGRNRPKHRSD